jgi:ADP-ribose pyrophosphatase YjhB (NUDIX family)
MIERTPQEGNDIWDFPKGRRFIEENIQQCALREFEEETNLSKDLVKLIENAGTYEDNYQGTDHKMYRSVYFVGYIANGMALKFQYQACPHQMRDPYISDEVMAMQWMDYATALDMITPTRRNVLEQIHSFLQNNYQE